MICNYFLLDCGLFSRSKSFKERPSPYNVLLFKLQPLGSHSAPFLPLISAWVPLTIKPENFVGSQSPGAIIGLLSLISGITILHYPIFTVLNTLHIFHLYLAFFGSDIKIKNKQRPILKIPGVDKIRLVLQESLI